MHIWNEIRQQVINDHSFLTEPTYMIFSTCPKTNIRAFRVPCEFYHVAEVMATFPADSHLFFSLLPVVTFV